LFYVKSWLLGIPLSRRARLRIKLFLVLFRLASAIAPPIGASQQGNGAVSLQMPHLRKAIDSNPSYTVYLNLSIRVLASIFIFFLPRISERVPTEQGNRLLERWKRNSLSQAAPG
jgi:hypothetical protein